MKNKTRITAIISSIEVCSTLIVSSAPVSAYSDMIYNYTRDSEQYLSFMNGCTEVNDYGLFESWTCFENSDEHPYKISVRKGGKTFVLEEYGMNQFSFNIKENTEEANASAAEIIEKYDANLTFVQTDNEYIVTDRTIDDTDLENARAICSELKENGLISSFIYASKISSSIEISCYYLTAYEEMIYGDIKAELEAYVEEKQLDCTVAEVAEGYNETFGDWIDSEVYCVIPNYEISVEEHCKLAKQIKDELGYSPYALSPTIAHPLYATVYDLYNEKKAVSQTITLYRNNDSGKYYMECDEMTEYFGETSDTDFIVRSVNVYDTNRYSYMHVRKYDTGVTGFSTLHAYPDVYVLEDDELLILQEYLSADYPEISLENTSEYNYTLNYGGSVTFKEQMQIAQNIRDNTGLCFDAHFLEDVLDVTIMEDFVYTAGDLNESGTIDISDAVSIMAHATNPEAYPLTDLQLLLGDVYQQGDGIGINDAVSIQKYLTKQIDSLPESTM